MALSQKQLSAIDELFNSGGDENQVLEKLKIKRCLWRRWITDRDFTDELAVRLGALQRQADVILLQYRPLAVATLIGLCKSQVEETSRKSCVDLLDLKPVPQEERFAPSQPRREVKFSPQAASKMLEILAADKRGEL